MAILGPPELYNPKPEGTQNQAPATVDDDFINLVVTNFNNITKLHDSPVMGYTENASPTFLSSGNPCLDFFFHILPDTPSESLIQRLQLAWEYNPLTTLKLICNLRGVRGTGKSDKDGFYMAALWLHRHHPKTLASNIGTFADFGCFKDLPEILYCLLEGPEARKVQKQEWEQRKNGYRSVKGSFMRTYLDCKPKRKNKNKRSDKPKEGKILSGVAQKKEKARALREQKRVAMAKKVVEKYMGDSTFRFLYDEISIHFAELLKADMEFLKSGKVEKISLASKWCPSLDSSYDRSLLLCESIARKIFPLETNPEYQTIEEAYYAYRIREGLRKEVLVPLRKALELPEVYIGKNDWGSIPYNRVASVAMKFYKEKFMKHDKERFYKYLDDVKSGKKKIAAGALLPHAIIRCLEDGDGGQVAEMQWKRMADDLSKRGKLKNCIAVCDVSGSMSGIPMEVSVAFGLLISEMSEEPWKGKVITFSEDPLLHVIDGEKLKSKIEFVRRMDWGRNTNFQKVFDRILEVGVDGKLKEEEMVKRVFVFSDMEFDKASDNPWESDYEAIVRKFSEKGYGNAVPEMVFWNLRDSRATPMPESQKGVALVSGYSKNLIKLFMDGDGIISPEVVMEAAISGEKYQNLVLLD